MTMHTAPACNVFAKGEKAAVRGESSSSYAPIVAALSTLPDSEREDLGQHMY